MNHKHAAILCPGSSLRNFPAAATGEYDFIIGVNRAVAHHPCDYWLFKDAYTATLCTPAGNPILVSGHGQLIRLGRMARTLPSLRGFQTLDYEPLELGGVFRAYSTWKRFSSTLAVALAEFLGAAVIDVYGADLRGSADWDGTANEKQRRSETRWNLERDIFLRMTELLDSAGVTLRRIGCEPATLVMGVAGTTEGGGRDAAAFRRSPCFAGTLRRAEAKQSSLSSGE